MALNNKKRRLEQLDDQMKFQMSSPPTKKPRLSCVTDANTNNESSDDSCQATNSEEWTQSHHAVEGIPNIARHNHKKDAQSC